jgi:dGTPase
VFFDPQGDHVRTRLTHTHEVAQIARSLARRLGLDEDLAEAVALSHDIGHPPFGHAGEHALDAALAECGGFDHNAHAVAVLERLERRYADFDGLNLTFETIEGVIAHNGPLVGPHGQRTGKAKGTPLPQDIAESATARGIDLTLHASAEAQCAAVADDVGYCCHDIEDVLRCGLLTFDDLREVAVVGPIVRSLPVQSMERERAANEVLRRMMSRMTDDVVATAKGRLNGLTCPDDVRRLGMTAVDFSDGMANEVRRLKAFMLARVYVGPQLVPDIEHVKAVVRDLAAIYLDDSSLLPDDVSGRRDVPTRVRDFVAGMTDRFAEREWRRLVMRQSAAGISL